MPQAQTPLQDHRIPSQQQQRDSPYTQAPTAAPSHRQQAIQPPQHGQRTRSTPSSSSAGSERGMPDRVGPYTILEEIGRGSFAIVHRGERVTANGNPVAVAIKAVVRSKLTSKLLGNLESEIRCLKDIKQRNVVELYDCLKTDAHIYLVMAYCAAGDLSQYIRKRGIVPGLPAGAADIRYKHPKDGGLHEMVVRCFLGQLSEALKFLYEKKIIHRDIKPQNLLLHPAVTSDILAGHPEGIPLLRVADFGFARMLPDASLADTLCGSPLYMAPEILRYEKYDAKADLWSVGAVSYEMSVGRPPFRAQNHIELLRRIERGGDRVRFPDEVQVGDLGQYEGDPQTQRSERYGNTVVAEDVKAVIRSLLRNKAVQRSSFEAFFASAEAVARWGEGSIAPGSIEVPPQQPERRPADASKPASRFTVPHVTPATDDQSGTDRVVTPLLFNQHGLPTDAALAPPLPMPSSADEQEPAFIRLPATPAAIPSLPASGRSTPSAGSQRRPNSVASNRQSKTAVNAPALSSRPANMAYSSRRVDNAEMGIAQATTRRPPHRIESGSPGTTPPSNLTLQAPTYRNALPQADLSVSSTSGADDSVLGREYVVIEKRNVEVNALADQLATRAIRPDTVPRRPSTQKGLLSRQLSSAVSMPSQALPNAEASPSPPSPHVPYPPSVNMAYDHPPFAAPRHTGQYSSSPLGRGFSGIAHYGTSPGKFYASNFANQAVNAAAAVSAVPGAALAKAFSLASLKLFGSPTEGIWLRKRGLRKPIERREAYIDPAEERLLASLEDIVQKATAIFDFADTRLVLMAPPPESHMVRSSRSYSSPFMSSITPPPAAQQHPQMMLQRADSPVSPMRRSPTHSSEVGSRQLPANIKAESLPGETLVLYFKAMAFLQKGIELTAQYSAKRNSSVFGPDVLEYVQWMRARFNDCHERADYAQSRLVGDVPDYTLLAERLIFDRALEMSRAAAVRELMGENAAECEIAYDTALWMLFAILDDTMQEGEPPDENSKLTIQQFVRSIQDRLDALRRKMRPQVS